MHTHAHKGTNMDTLTPAHEHMQAHECTHPYTCLHRGTHLHTCGLLPVVLSRASQWEGGGCCGCSVGDWGEHRCCRGWAGLTLPSAPCQSLPYLYHMPLTPCQGRLAQG